MIEKIFHTKKGNIHYWVSSQMEKEAPTLVFLPGLTADHRLFEKQIAYFEGKRNVLVCVLVVTYLVGALFSAIMFLIVGKDTNIMKEIGKMNWAPYVLGIVIVGLEVGYIYAYQAGWSVSTAAIVQSSFLAIALLVIGALIYQEALTWNKRPPQKAVSKIRCFNGTDKGTADIGLFSQLFLRPST